MSDDTEFQDWSEREEMRISRLRGSALLEGRWEFAEQFRSRDPDRYAEELMSLLHEASHEGRFDFKLKAFTELRRLYASSERFAYLRDDILWYFKWIVGVAPEYADVPESTIQLLLDEMEQLYRAEKESLKPVYMYRCQTAMFMGRVKETDEWLSRWEKEPKTKSDDCPACEAALLMRVHLERKDDAGALKAGEIFYKLENWCDATPDSVSWLIGPAVRQNNLDLAYWIHRMALRDVRQRAGMLGALGSHLVYCGYSSDQTRARRLALIGLRKALQAGSDRDRYFFYRAISFWCVYASLYDHAHLTLPTRLLPSLAGESTPPEVTSVVQASQIALSAATEIANRFDARNGTRRYMDAIDQDHESIRQTIASRQNPPKEE